MCVGKFHKEMSVKEFHKNKKELRLDFFEKVLQSAQKFDTIYAVKNKEYCYDF